MPSGSMPSYDYRPSVKSTELAKVRTCSSRRARLTNDTYFRVREPGLPGNNISVEMIEYEPEEDAVVVVTNHNIKYSENVDGPAITKFLSLNKAKATDLWIIRDVTTTPRIEYNSISLRIAFQMSDAVTTQLGAFAFDKVFSSGKLSVQLTKNDAQAASNSIISIAPRHRIYRLKWGSKTTEATADGPGETTYGWDIDDLRAQINASDPWIEMKPRTPKPAEPEGGGPMPERGKLIDAQDDGEDAVWLTPFAETFLSGGDGLPDIPTVEKTGPTRSLVHVNYGEKDDGTLGEANIMYEWVGDTAKVGVWKAY